MKTTRATLFAACLWLAACGGGEPDAGDAAAVGDDTAAAPMSGMDTMGATGPDPMPAGAASGAAATAPMRDASGRDLGAVSLAETGNGIRVSGTLRGLPPGTLAIHVHTTGRCEPPFESAGGHWNPTNTQHGTENPRGPHLGDMPNVEVGADSTATVNVSTPAGATLRGANGLLDGDGAAVVVHAGADDYRTDPSGASGDRIACGVVSGT
ncbi:MAG TPA: superoxide dismutase family protein [Longimicrobiaceae bacterium]|nr:superoxide dismutase family protein [Longimicrobiaceae bacterium]